MFIGRERELAVLTDSIKKNNTAALVYGKRRVGKTTLIKTALEGSDNKSIYYECIKGSLKDNVDLFVKGLRERGILGFSAEFSSFQDVFSYLNSLNSRFTVVIDEYPYLKTMTAGESIDSSFQYIIDNLLSNISLILSGSQISVMKEMLSEGNALYGRFGCVIDLKEMSYLDAALFYPNKEAYEKIAFFSVFGGSPFVLEKIRAEDSLEDNIKDLILNENSAVHLYASYLLLSDYANSINAERIFSVLGNGKKRYSVLENALGNTKTGNTAKQLKALMAMDIIRQSSPINKIGDKKKTTYELNDNLLRFFFTYVYPNRSALKMLGTDAFYKEYIEKTITTFISYRFEEQCRAFFSLEIQRGRLTGIKNIGTYYYDDPVNRMNGEYDVALDLGGHYELYEVKYYKNPMTLDEIHREAAQMRAIKELEVAGIGFIAANGFEKKEERYKYYTAEDIYK